MRIAFHLYDFSVHGSQIATYDYAKGNKILLHNESIIVCPKTCFNTANEGVIQLFEKEFGEIFTYSSQEQLDILIKFLACEVLYILKSGEDDGVGSNLKNVKVVVHCTSVCTKESKHGDIYAGVSTSVLGKYYDRDTDYTFQAPVVPHICIGGISSYATKKTRNFRSELIIPDDAIVFGRYGGYDSFDIKFVHDAIVETVSSNPNIYFVFMNTAVFAKHPHIIYLNPSIDSNIKESFIGMCDAMIHAKSIGESFGLSVAEFALRGKAIITYEPLEKNYKEHSTHRTQLGDKGIYYRTYNELLDIFRTFTKRIYTNTGYYQYTDERVMKQFDRVFLKRKQWSVRPMCNFMSTPDLINCWSKLGKADMISLTTDCHADYTMIVNKPPCNEAFNPSNTIVFRMEPNEDDCHVWNDWYIDRKDFLIFGNHNNYHNNCEWNLSMNEDSLNNSIEKDPTLDRCVSAIISDRMSDEGQKLRIQFVQHLQNQTDIDVHVYGRGNPGFREHRGELPYHSKDNGVLPYKYGFNAENVERFNYFSEKLTDLILGECLAFYWGCPNVEEYIDARAFIRLDLRDIEGSAQIVRTAIETDEWSRRLPYILEAKQRILTQYGFLPRLQNLIHMTHLRIALITTDQSLGDRLAQSDARVKGAVVFKTYERANQACLESDVDWLVLSGSQTVSSTFFDRLSQFYADLKRCVSNWGAGITYCYHGMTGDGYWSTGMVGGDDVRNHGPIMSYIISPRGASVSGYPHIHTNGYYPVGFCKRNIC